MNIAIYWHYNIFDTEAWLQPRHDEGAVVYDASRDHGVRPVKLWHGVG